MNKTQQFTGSCTKLITPSGAVFQFPSPISKLIDCLDWAIVLLETTPSLKMNENVVAINVDGTKRYQLPSSALRDDADEPYQSMELKDGVLEAYCWNSFLVRADPSSGKVLSRTL